MLKRCFSNRLENLLMNRSGENLIFVISQPRSGSTLLQHMLGSHSDIHTLPEPWILLHPIYALKKKGINAEYNADYARIALEGFLNVTENGHAKYAKSMQDFLVTMYESAIENTGKRYFLDKTPRYYFVIDEILKIFPSAKIVLLVRNPAAVATSILNTNFSGDWQKLFKSDRKHDLITAPREILKALQTHESSVAYVRYEDLVVQPETVIKKLCNYISVPYEREMLQYRTKVKFSDTTFIDPKSIYRHTEPVIDYINEWKNQLGTKQQIRIISDFICELGKETIDALGYSSRDILDELLNLSKQRSGWTVSFAAMTSPLVEPRAIDRFKMGMVKSLQDGKLLFRLLRAVNIKMKRLMKYKLG